MPAFLDSVTDRPLGDGVSHVYSSGIVADQQRKLVYILDDQGSGVAVYDPDAAQIVGDIAVPGVSNLEAMALSPDGRHLYVSAAGDDQLGIVDLARNPPSVSIRLEVRATASAAGMRVTPDGKRLVLWRYVIGSFVTIVDLASSQTHMIRVDNQPTDVAVNPAGTRAYVICHGQSYVNVIDLTLSPPKVIDTIYGFSGPNKAAFGPDGRRLYVTNSRKDFSGIHSISVVAV